MSTENKQVSINGEFIKGYQSIHLIQKINEHHSFEVSIDLETIEKEGAYTIDKSKEWLGKTIIISVHEKDFTGIITNISLNHDRGHHGQIVLSGYSSTIALENGEHMQSFLKKNLTSIVETVAKHPKITASVKPEYTSEIIYETQYLETHFRFLQRLAKQYHEWFYYDGDTLFFGKPKLDAPIELIYGPDISEMKIGIQTGARKYESFSYNSSMDEQYISKSPDSPAGLNELGQLAFSAALDTYTAPTNLYARMRIGNKSDLDTHLKKKQQSAFASSNYISLKTSKRGLTVGSVIDLRSEIVAGKGNVTAKRHGTYIITQIDHIAKVGNSYYNNIIALPADIKALPEPSVNFPVAETQMATVIDNEDPDGKGRVQVRMHWQTGEMKTWWVRVLTPDGGKSDKVSMNRGFVFIPEVNDQVLVSFRYNDPNRPFILGSLYNGRTGVGGDKENKIKSITTRSGSTVTFDDNEGKGNITVSDPSGNAVVLNGDGTITISAPEKIDIISKEINLTAEDKININGDNEVNIGSKATSVEGTDIVSLRSDTQMTGEAPSVSIKGAQTTLVEGKLIDIKGDAMTNVKGKILNLN
ncbi:phage baseplate assembly protein V [Tenacibaculum maritimum]|uniref:type VI secretion system Vgr family protein n=1 Tax=Tenacibaculum maritimum TaxID=107401 RepID=UPI00230773C6|nr:phage baseplate assembly protein V [Tenacibaculum maritimum]MDB0613245.1 phage baseplate assembly protein V [Tenacibaculum maritimum]